MTEIRYPGRTQITPKITQHKNILYDIVRLRASWLSLVEVIVIVGVVRELNTQ